MKKTFSTFTFILILCFFVLPKISSASVTLNIANTSPTSNISTLTSTSVTLNATGLSSTALVIITVDNNPTSVTTPAYHLSSTGTQANFSGEASSNFYALAEGGQYKAKVVYSSSPNNILATIDFTTKAYYITSFSFAQVNPVATGFIDKHTIIVSVPYGTNVTALVPTIVVSSGATVSPASLAPQNFSNSVTYVLTGDDGSTKNYTAVVTIENNIPAITKITSFSPTSGKAGDLVTINGDKLGEVNKVLFNNTETTNFTLYGETKIVVNVPNGATTGKISLETISGTNVVSSTDFTVNGSSGNGTCNDGILNQDETGIDMGGVCAKPDAPTKTGGPGVLVPCANNCEFKDLLTLVNNIINFLLKVIALPIAAIMFAYAGFLLVVSGGASEKRTKAKNIFINVAIGLIIAAAAWLIVHTILVVAGYQSSWGSSWLGLQ